MWTQDNTYTPEFYEEKWKLVNLNIQRLFKNLAALQDNLNDLIKPSLTLRKDACVQVGPSLWKDAIPQKNVAERLIRTRHSLDAGKIEQKTNKEEVYDTCTTLNQSTQKFTLNITNVSRYDTFPKISLCKKVDNINIVLPIESKSEGSNAIEFKEKMQPKEFKSTSLILQEVSTNNENSITLPLPQRNEDSPFSPILRSNLKTHATSTPQDSLISLSSPEPTKSQKRMSIENKTSISFLQRKERMLNKNLYEDKEIPPARKSPVTRNFKFSNLNESYISNLACSTPRLLFFESSRKSNELENIVKKSMSRMHFNKGTVRQLVEKYNRLNKSSNIRSERPRVNAQSIVRKVATSWESGSIVKVQEILAQRQISNKENTNPSNYLVNRTNKDNDDYKTNYSERSSIDDKKIKNSVCSIVGRSLKDVDDGSKSYYKSLNHPYYNCHPNEFTCKTAITKTNTNQVFIEKKNPPATCSPMTSPKLGRTSSLPNMLSKSTLSQQLLSISPIDRKDDYNDKPYCIYCKNSQSIWCSTLKKSTGAIPKKFIPFKENAIDSGYYGRRGRLFSNSTLIDNSSIEDSSPVIVSN